MGGNNTTRNAYPKEGQELLFFKKKPTRNWFSYIIQPIDLHRLLLRGWLGPRAKALMTFGKRSPYAVQDDRTISKQLFEGFIEVETDQEVKGALQSRNLGDVYNNLAKSW